MGDQDFYTIELGTPWEGMESFRLLPEGETSEHRIVKDGVWNYKEGDVLTPIPIEVLQAERMEQLLEEAERLAEKGHDCHDNVYHYTLDRGLGNGSFYDVYDCSICHENLQVG